VPSTAPPSVPPSARTQGNAPKCVLQHNQTSTCSTTRQSSCHTLLAAHNNAAAATDMSDANDVRSPCNTSGAVNPGEYPPGAVIFPVTEKPRLSRLSPQSAMTFSVQQNVAGLHVTMYNAQTMQVCQTLHSTVHASATHSIAHEAEPSPKPTRRTSNSMPTAWVTE